MDFGAKFRNFYCFFWSFNVSQQMRFLMRAAMSRFFPVLSSFPPTRIGIIITTALQSRRRGVVARCRRRGIIIMPASALCEVVVPPAPHGLTPSFAFPQRLEDRVSRLFLRLCALLAALLEKVVNALWYGPSLLIGFFACS
jgi:hypothetical protein